LSPYDWRWRRYDDFTQYMHTEIVTAAIPILINHKVLLEDVDKWLAKRREIYRRKNLSYVSTPFYAMRCIFWQGRHQPTLDFESMKVDRLPQKSSDFNIRVPSKDATKDERDKCIKGVESVGTAFARCHHQGKQIYQSYEGRLQSVLNCTVFFMNTLLT